MVGSIHGTVADACVLILKHHDIGPAMKWVDDFVFFRTPLSLPDREFTYNLLDILHITLPLGIPWHPITRKGQDFGNSFAYVGFIWDIEQCTMSVPDDKHECVMRKHDFILDPKNTVFSRHDIASIHSSLQHLTFVYRNGRHALTNVSSFLSHFPNDFTRHHLPKTMRSQLTWWHDVLSHPDILHSLTPLKSVDKDIWIDALTSWGIGL